MLLNEYQRQANETADYPDECGLEYTALGLAGEAGEYCNKVMKIFRGDNLIDDIHVSLAHELGDVLWYVSECAGVIGYTLQDIARMNLDKLKQRQSAETLKGSGDER